MSSTDAGKQVFQFPALGRHFDLGTLYDARTDAIVPSFNFLSEGDLSSVKTVVNKYTECDLIASDKLSEKFSQLKICGSFKMGIMCGLIDVNGSANYLNKSKSNYPRLSVHVRLHYRTEVKSLTMGHLTKGSIGYLEEANTVRNNMATPVVGEIQYGANVTFTFSKRIEKEDSESTVNGQLNSCGEKFVKLLNGLAIGGDGDFSNTVIGDGADIECTFKSDFHLPNNSRPPKTYKEAIEFARIVMQSLSQSTEGVPCQILLHPLVMLPGITRDVPTLHYEISDPLASKFVQLAEDYDLLEEKANNLLNDQLVSKLIPFRRKLEDFKGYLDSFRDEINIKLKKLLVDIRSGRQESVTLTQLLDSINDPNFPYYPTRLDQWLTDKHRELLTLKMRFIEPLTAAISKDCPPERVLVFPDAMKLQEQMFKASVSYAFHFVFTILGRSSDLFLDRMKNQKGFSSMMNETAPGSSITSRLSWYEDELFLEKLEREVIIFVNSIQSHIGDSSRVFAFTTLFDENQQTSPGSSIVVYKRGTLCIKRNDTLRTLCQPFLKERNPFMNVINQLIAKQGRNDYNVQMDSTYQNALIFLCRKYQEDNLIDFVRLLVECGVDVNCKDNNGWYALHLLCHYYGKENLIDIVRLLIENGIDVHCKTNKGTNALHLLCEYYPKINSIDIVRLLVENGIDVNGKDQHGWNALHLLCRFYEKENLIDIVRLLIEKGIDVNSKTGNYIDNGVEYGGFHALHFLCWKHPKENLLNLVQLLVQHGIDKNVKSTHGIIGNARSLLLDRYPEHEVREIVQLLRFSVVTIDYDDNPLFCVCRQ